MFAYTISRSVAPKAMIRRFVTLVALAMVAFTSFAESSMPAFAAGPPVSRSKSTVVASPTSVPADGVTTSTITVVLRTKHKQPVSGKTVSVSRASGPGSPVISPATAVTDTNGQAQFTVSSTTAGTDVFQATDVTDALVINQTATVTFQPGPASAANSTVGAAPASVVADGATRSTVTVTLIDAHGNLVPGKTVTLAQTGGTAFATISPASGPSSATGVVTFTVTSPNVGNAVFQATDVTDSVVITQTATVNFVAAPASASVSTVSASPTSVPADGTTASTVTVTLLDAYGHPVAGKTISVAKIAGAGTPVISNASTNSNITNASGVATFTVTSTTGANDTFQATDTTDSLPLTQTVVITFTPNTSPDNSTVVANPTSVVADGTTSSTITVTLLDTGSNAVPGHTVSVAKIAGGGTPLISPASAVTDSSGVATFTVTSTTAATDTFQATDNTAGTALGQTPTITFVPGPANAANSTFTAAPASVPDDGATGSVLTVTLLDAHGNPVPGKTVTVAKISGPGSPVVGPASGPSNLSGVVTFSVTSTTAGTDVFQATDTTDGVVISPTASVTFQLGPVDPNQSTVVANPTSVPANGTGSTVTVTLVDATNNPISGKMVTLAETAGSAVTINPAAGTVTDASGVATFIVSATTPDSDTFQATDTTDGVALNQTPTVVFFGVPTAIDSTVTANPSSVAVGPPGSTITVTLDDTNGNPVPGKTVTLAQTAGPGTPTIGPASGPSAADGTVTFNVQSTTLGTDTFQATDTTDGVVITQTANVTFVTGPVSDAHSSVVASPTSITADGVMTSTVTVTLHDAFDDPVSGKAVSLAKTAGPGSPVITGPSPVMTDGSGQTTFTVASTTAGTDTFQATDTTDSVALSQTPTVTFVAGGVDTGSAHSTVVANPTSVTADGSTISTITVTLADSNNNPISGKAVTLAQTAGPGSPVITGPSPATTDANGQTTFTVSSTTAGVDTFQATDTTDSATLAQTPTVTFVAGPVNDGNSTVVASPSSVVADGVQTSTITVTLEDGFGNGVSGKALTLATTAGPGSPVITGPSPPTTDASGQTTFTVASTTAGIDTFQATDTTDSLALSQTPTVTFVAGGIDTGGAHSTVVANPTSVPADGSTTSTITVTLADSQNNPISGKAVSLSQTAGPGSPVIVGPSPAFTDANGQTTFTVTSTTAGIDTFQATDTTDSAILAQTADVTFVAGPVSDGHSTVLANPTTVHADGVQTSTVTVTLQDVNGNPVSGKAVTLGKSAGPGSPVVTGPSPATTDANGQTTFTVSSTTGGTDTFQATDTTDSLALTQTPTITFVPPPQVSAIAPTSGPTNGGTAITITGVNFTTTGTTTVSIGGAAATAVTVVNATKITAVTGAHATAGAFDVVVTNPDGQTGTLVGGYTYVMLPTTQMTSSRQQSTLTSSDGSSWQTMNHGPAAITLNPAQDQSTLVTGNADLWTSQAGFNQDMGIFVSVDNVLNPQPLAWKESGGFAGTFSPNAAYVQTVYSMTHGHSYAFMLMWKTNKPAPGATIWAGAGPINGLFSPTTLMTKTFPAGTVPDFQQITTQPTQTNSDGVTWVPLGLSSSVLHPTADSVAILGANSDLWTSTVGYNQDLGIFVSDNGAAVPAQPLAWKESGGFAGTFSPNAAFVKATYLMRAGHSYQFSLGWKTNRDSRGTGAKIWAGAGPINGSFSPTSLYVESVLNGAAAPSDDMVTTQPTSTNSDGTTWRLVNGVPTLAITPGASMNLVLGANADLWTSMAGYNQDLEITATDNGGVEVQQTWKESGGFAGTFSPNAAMAQALYHMTAGHTYVFTLRWKTNISATNSGDTMWAGAGPINAAFSPTRLTAELTN